MVRRKIRNRQLGKANPRRKIQRQLTRPAMPAGPLSFCDLLSSPYLTAFLLGAIFCLILVFILIRNLL